MNEVSENSDKKVKNSKAQSYFFTEKFLFFSKIKQNFDKIEMNYLVIILVALSMGVTGLSDLAMNYLYKDDLNLEPSEVAKINSIAFIPWIIKPVYGFISDSFPIFGYRRKSYLFIFGIVVMSCWILMSVWARTVNEVISIVMINQVSTAFCNVIGEALVVETSQKQKEKDPESGSKNVSLFFLVKSIGSLLSSFSSGALLAYMEKRKIFLITASFPIMIVISSILLDEKKFISKEGFINSNATDYNTIETNNPPLTNNKQSDLRTQISLFLSFLKMDLIYKPIIFIFLYMLAPSYGDPLFYFYTNILKFSPMTMGRLRLIYGLASVSGIWFFNKYLRTVSFKTIMWWTTILSMFFNMLSIIVVTRFNLQIGIPDFLFCMAADALTTALAEINTLPLLVLACNICPKNIEGTLYAFIMSVINFGSLISNQFGGYITFKLGITATKFDNLSTLIFIANVVLILPMPSLYLVNEKSYVPELHENNEEINPTFIANTSTEKSKKQCIDSLNEDMALNNKEVYKETTKLLEPK